MGEVISEQYQISVKINIHEGSVAISRDKIREPAEWKGGGGGQVAGQVQGVARRVLRLDGGLVQ